MAGKGLNIPTLTKPAVPGKLRSLSRTPDPAQHGRAFGRFKALKLRNAPLQCAAALCHHARVVLRAFPLDAKISRGIRMEAASPGRHGHPQSLHSGLCQRFAKTWGRGLPRRGNSPGVPARQPRRPRFPAPYLFWNSQHYTRNLIDKTDLYELLAICWEVGMSSSIHNHKDQNCWMAAPIGRLQVHNYRVLEEDLGAQHCNIVPTDVVEITAFQPGCRGSAQPGPRRSQSPQLRSSGRSACTSTRVRLTPASCIPSSSTAAARSGCITRRCTASWCDCSSAAPLRATWRDFADD